MKPRKIGQRALRDGRGYEVMDTEKLIQTLRFYIGNLRYILASGFYKEYPYEEFNRGRLEAYEDVLQLLTGSTSRMTTLKACSWIRRKTDMPYEVTQYTASGRVVNSAVFRFKMVAFITSWLMSGKGIGVLPENYYTEVKKVGA